MKQFLQHVKESIYGPVYYQEILAKSFLYSWKYYSGLALIIGVFITIVISIPLVGLVNEKLNTFPAEFVAYYPDALEITVSNGALTSNVVEPYFLLPPPSLRGIMQSQGVDNMVVIDTVTPFSIEKFKEYRTYAWLGGKELAMFDNKNGVKLQPYDKKASSILTKEDVKIFFTILEPYYKFVAPLMVICIFIGLMVAFGMNFILLLIGALLILILGRFMGMKWTYGESYRIGLHATTLPMLIFAVIFFVPFLHINMYLYAAVTLALVYVNFKDAPKASTVQPSITSTPPEAPQI